MDFDNPQKFLDFGGFSKHFGGRQEYNEVNPNIGITLEDVENRLVKAVMAGVYKNSFDDTSFYAGGHLAHRFGNDFYADLGISGGVITGYENQTGQKLTPMAALMLQLGRKGVGRVKLQYVPRLSDKDPSLLMGNIGFEF